MDTSYLYPLAAVNTDVPVSESLLSILSVITWEWSCWLDVILCLAFRGTGKLFPTAAAFRIPTSNIWGFQFLFANIHYFIFLNYYFSDASRYFWFAFP